MGRHITSAEAFVDIPVSLVRQAYITSSSWIYTTTCILGGCVQQNIDLSIRGPQLYNINVGHAYEISMVDILSNILAPRQSITDIDLLAEVRKGDGDRLEVRRRPGAFL